MISSFFLGAFGFISWFDASTENYHTADVCLISTVYHDGYEWACPQVQATNQITWILAVSLVIPAPTVSSSPIPLIPPQTSPDKRNTTTRQHDRCHSNGTYSGTLEITRMFR